MSVRAVPKHVAVEYTVSHARPGLHYTLIDFQAIAVHCEIGLDQSLKLIRIYMYRISSVFANIVIDFSVSLYSAIRPTKLRE